MPADLALNTYTPHRWARVVSGETWAEYALGESGLIEAQTMRGPLIVWATKTGGGTRPYLDYVMSFVASLPDVPTASMLELQAARVNTRAHFLAFVRAAHGKVRASVRWKTGARVRRLRKLGTLAMIGCESQPNAYGVAQYLNGHGTWSWARTLRSDRRILHLCFSIKNESNTSVELVEHLRKNYELIKVEYAWYEEIRREFRDVSYLLPAPEMSQALMYALAVGDMSTVALIFANLKARRGFQRNLREAVALRFLEAAAYRAHITRRVRPPARRARIPRPLYAQPRPPTAPLAPPVA